MRYPKYFKEKYQDIRRTLDAEIDIEKFVLTESKLRSELFSEVLEEFSTAWIV